MSPELSGHRHRHDDEASRTRSRQLALRTDQDTGRFGGDWAGGGGRMGTRGVGRRPGAVVHGPKRDLCRWSLFSERICRPSHQVCPSLDESTKGATGTGGGEGCMMRCGQRRAANNSGASRSSDSRAAGPVSSGGRGASAGASRACRPRLKQPAQVSRGQRLSAWRW